MSFHNTNIRLWGGTNEARNFQNGDSFSVYDPNNFRTKPRVLRGSAANVGNVGRLRCRPRFQATACARR